MQKFLANYATAAHLAILAVAPLFLSPFCAQETVATCLLWLSLLVATWVVMSPACRSGEPPHMARERLLADAVRDPAMWFMLVVVAYAGVRALNGGVALAYDAELGAWSLKRQAVEILPGCTDGAGCLPFATTVALAVLLLGARHALDASSAVAFFATATLLAGLSAAISAIALTYGGGTIAGIAACSYESPSFIGAAYGIHLLGGIVALFGCVEQGWHRVEPLVAIGLVCTAAGLTLFSPIATFAVFAAVFIVFALVSFAVSSRRLAGSGSFRCALVLVMVAAVPVLMAMFASSFGPLAQRAADALELKFFPEGFLKSRDVLSSIALKSWTANPWFGSGLGSFHLDVRFIATQDDWLHIAPWQAAAMNGWWQLLAERGVAGALLLALGAAFLAWTFFARAVRSFRSAKWSSLCFIGLFSAAALAALAFVDCSFLRPDVLLAAAAALSLAACAFRRTSSRNTGN